MTLTVEERPLLFGCNGNRLLGVFSPGSLQARTGVVIVVGGPQYRVGSHRQFVQLARALAAEGHPVLRFDVRGMGDSDGALRHFEEIDEDISSAIDAFVHEAPNLRGVVLWGLCDGASAALLYVYRNADPRIVGLALLNPWVRSSQTLARAHMRHYYRSRVFDRQFWRKLIRGGIGRGALVGLLHNLRQAICGDPNANDAPEVAFPQRMAMGWGRFRGKILLLVSESDLTAQEFLGLIADDTTWQSALAAKPARRVMLPGADHTLSDPEARVVAERATVEWLREMETGA